MPPSNSDPGLRLGLPAPRSGPSGVGPLPPDLANGVLAALAGRIPEAVLVEDGWGRTLLANAAFHDLVGRRPTGSAAILPGPQRASSDPAAPAAPIGLAELGDLCLDPSALLPGNGPGGESHEGVLSLRDGRELHFQRILSAGEAGRPALLWIFRMGSALPDAPISGPQPGPVATQEDLRAALAEAMSVASHRSQLLSAVSHEVRTPLTGILGMVELLLLEPLPDSIRDAVVGVRRSGNAVLELLDNLLGMGRLDQADDRPAQSPFAFRELVDSVAQTLGRGARASGLALSWRIDPDVPTMLVSDEGRLRQVLLNLLANSIKFTRAGEVALVASVAPAPPGSATGSGDRWLVIEVSDTGPGLTPQEAERVFDPFVQGAAATATAAKGVGLGLALTKRLVESLGGRVTVTSQPGAGAQFTVQLPGIDLSSPATASGGDSCEAPGPGSDMLAGLSVAVFSDLPKARAAVAACLDAAGAQVTELGELPGEQLTDGTRGDQRGTAPGCVVLIGDPGDPGIAGALAGLERSAPGCRAVLLSVRDVPRESLEGATVLPIPSLRTALLAAVAGQPPESATTPDLPPRFERAGRILLADDDPVSRAMLRAMLIAMGLSCTAVADGSEAVAEVTATAGGTPGEPANGFDVVLMDVNMPVLDGLAATRAIRELPGEVGRLPILALTASVLAGAASQCLDAGMDGVVPKPVDLRGLHRALSPYLQALPAQEGSAGRAGHDPLAAGGTGGEGLPAGPDSAGSVSSGSQSSGSDRPAGADGPALEELLDLDLLATLCEDLGDSEVVGEMLDMFRHELPARLAGISASVKSGDPSGIRRAAHALASPCATLGVVALCTASRELEHCGYRGDDPQVPGLLARIEDVARASDLAVTEYRGSLG